MVVGVLGDGGVNGGVVRVVGVRVGVADGGAVVGGVVVRVVAVGVCVVVDGCVGVW